MFHDYQDIQQSFNAVITYTQNIPAPQTDELFAEWLEAKRFFIEAMDGKLIYEYPEKVSFELSEKDKRIRVDDFINLVGNRWNQWNLVDFLEECKDSFFENRVPMNYNLGDKVISAGTKLIKAFKYFVDDEKVLNDIQTVASMIIQEDKVEGILCFSVHPLDYITSSENTHNWRSCHALDGDYRSGNLSYMVDSSTIMCYLKSAKDEQLAAFPPGILWNSKKWRVLLFFSNDWRMIFAGRQYPFTTSSGLNFVKDKCLAKFAGDLSEWTDKKITHFQFSDTIKIPLWDKYIVVGENLKALNRVITNKPHSLHYNDLLRSSCYDPYYCCRMGFMGRPLTTETTKLEIGGGVKCLRCGQEYIEFSETMMCNDCELEYGECADDEIFSSCSCCGARYMTDEAVYVEGSDEYVCPHCANESTSCCDNCGERYFNIDLGYDKERRQYECPCCRESQITTSKRDILDLVF